MSNNNPENGQQQSSWVPAETPATPTPTPTPDPASPSPAEQRAGAGPAGQPPTPPYRPVSVAPHAVPAASGPAPAAPAAPAGTGGYVPPVTPADASSAPYVPSAPGGSAPYAPPASSYPQATAYQPTTGYQQAPVYPPAQQGPQAGYGGPVPPQAPSAARSASKNPIAALFDFSFTTYATTGIAKIVYVLTVVANVLGWLLITFSLFGAGRVSYGYGYGSAGPGMGIVALLFGWIPALINIAVMRLLLEFCVVSFRTSETLTEIKAHLATKDAA